MTKRKVLIALAIASAWAVLSVTWAGVSFFAVMLFAGPHSSSPAWLGSILLGVCALLWLTGTVQLVRVLRRRATRSTSL